MTTVPRLWSDGRPVVILGGGPSLTAVDVDACRGRAHVIAIKDAIRLAPWADVLYGCDAKWWQHYGDSDEVRAFTGARYALEPLAMRWATVLRYTGELGLELDPTALRTGRNSGYQAINLAVHLGARRIVLLGYDCAPGATGQRNWFGQRPPSYWLAVPAWDQSIVQCWASIVAPLKVAHVEVLNATPKSVLPVFPRVALQAALAEAA